MPTLARESTGCWRLDSTSLAAGNDASTIARDGGTHARAPRCGRVQVRTGCRDGVRGIAQWLFVRVGGGRRRGHNSLLAGLWSHRRDRASVSQGAQGITSAIILIVVVRASVSLWSTACDSLAWVWIYLAREMRSDLKISEMDEQNNARSWHEITSEGENKITSAMVVRLHKIECREIQGLLCRLL